MIWQKNLIKLYFYLCEDRSIQGYLQNLRMSNNGNLHFTDEEILTIYLFGIVQNMSKVKHIYQYTAQHLKDWFPQLPSYQAFNARLNRLEACFNILINGLIKQDLVAKDIHEKVLDSLPIMVAGNSRSSSAKVAKALCSKGYCSSKGIYYYGLKLHALNIVQAEHIPKPYQVWITAAAENDLTAARPILEHIGNSKLYADKIYTDAALNEELQTHQNSIILTPIKNKKGQKIKDAATAIYSTLVSRVRQPIESFFNWINEKTNIQNAQRVRSEQGLLVHIWGKFAAAILLLTQFFNS